MKNSVLFPLLTSAATLFSVNGFVVKQQTSPMKLCASALEEVDVNDPFETYEQTPGQRLAFKDTLVGDGEPVQKGQTITVAYEGRLMATGKTFDTGIGFSFELGSGRVIPGWEQGLEGMRVGGKRSLRIPPELAYAERGAGEGVIPPGSHLEFDCELLSIIDNPLVAAYAKLNWQKERTITFVLLLILLAASSTVG